MKIDVTADARFADIGNLPSNFIPYNGEFTKLNIRQILLSELKLLSRAAATNDISSTIKAINMTIDVDINRLTIGDFFYVLMWHKLHSFPKSPVTVNWLCAATLHLDADGNIITDQTITPAKIEPCNQANTQIIHQTDIDIISFEDGYEGIPANFDYPRVSMLAEYYELAKDPDFSELLDNVRWIREGATLAKKFEYLETLPNLDLYSEAEEINKATLHGVSQYVHLKCARCEGKHRRVLDLDPVNFFRPCL